MSLKCVHAGLLLLLVLSACTGAYTSIGAYQSYTNGVEASGYDSCDSACKVRSADGSECVEFAQGMASVCRNYIPRDRHLTGRSPATTQSMQGSQGAQIIGNNNKDITVIINK